jgi:hypothetical protein
MSLLTTWARVSACCPGASLITEVTTQDIILEDVARVILEDVYGDRTEEAQRYLAGHLAALSVSATAGGSGGSVAGPRVSESVGGVSVSYADATASLSDHSRYDETSCGRRLMQIQREVGAGKGPVWVV